MCNDGRPTLLNRVYPALMLGLMIVEIILLGILVWSESFRHNESSNSPNVACRYFHGERCFAHEAYHG